MSDNILITIDNRQYLLDLEKALAAQIAKPAIKFKSGDIFVRSDGYKRIMAWVAQDEDTSFWTLLGFNCGFDIDYTELYQPLSTSEMIIWLDKFHYQKIGNVNEAFCKFFTKEVLEKYSTFPLDKR